MEKARSLSEPPYVLLQFVDDEALTKGTIINEIDKITRIMQGTRFTLDIIGLAQVVTY